MKVLDFKSQIFIETRFKSKKYSLTQLTRINVIVYAKIENVMPIIKLQQVHYPTIFDTETNFI